MMTLKKMCWTNRYTNFLTYFCKEIENMHFDTKPNYAKLIKMLEDLYVFEKNENFEKEFIQEAKEQIL